MSIVKQFKEFIVRGNVIDMAVGIVIGGAFTGIVKSLVDDVIMPPIGLLMGGVDFSNLFLTLKEGATAAGPYHTLEAAKTAGAVTVNIGLFINTLISFVIVGFVIFMLIKVVNRLKHEDKVEAEAVTKSCEFCCEDVPIKAVRCPHCTSEI